MPRSGAGRQGLEDARSDRVSRGSFSSAPAPVDKVPALAPIASPLGGHPARTRPRRPFPAAGHPTVSTPVPPVIARDPDVSRCWGQGPTLINGPGGTETGVETDLWWWRGRQGRCRCDDIGDQQSTGHHTKERMSSVHRPPPRSYDLDSTGSTRLPLHGMQSSCTPQPIPAAFFAVLRLDPCRFYRHPPQVITRWSPVLQDPTIGPPKGDQR
jgi:hypothetical protein